MSVMTRARLPHLILAMSASLAFVFCVAVKQPQATQQTAAPKSPSRVTIRGCLTGSKLTQIDPRDPQDPKVTLPDSLNVTSIRVIRGQIKALNGHQVDVIGTLRGIPGLENGLLVADSGRARLYIGGGDPSLGEDLRLASSGPPTISAYTIKDIAPTCPAGNQ